MNQLKQELFLAFVIFIGSFGGDFIYHHVITKDGRINWYAVLLAMIFSRIILGLAGINNKDPE